MPFFKQRLSRSNLESMVEIRDSTISRLEREKDRLEARLKDAMTLVDEHKKTLTAKTIRITELEKEKATYTSHAKITKQTKIQRKILATLRHEFGHHLKRMEQSIDILDPGRQLILNQKRAIERHAITIERPMVEGEKDANEFEGKVTPEDILTELRKFHGDSKVQLILDNPNRLDAEYINNITTFGMYILRLQLDSSLFAEFKLWVVPSAENTNQ